MSRRSLPLLGDARIANPCTQAWGSMRGGEERRHCEACGKDVHNLSALPAHRAAELVASEANPPCLRYLHDGAGTIFHRPDAGTGRPAQRLLGGAFGGADAIVLATLSALVAVVAADRVVRVRRAGLASEAYNSVVQIAKDSKTAYEREGMPSGVLGMTGGMAVLSNNLCSSGSDPVPADPAAVRGRAYQSQAAEWKADGQTDGKGWACLKYSMSDPQRYAYTYTSTSPGPRPPAAYLYTSERPQQEFLVVAEGDLDGDGVRSRFSLRGAVVSGVVFVEPSVLAERPDE